MRRAVLLGAVVALLEVGGCGQDDSEPTPGSDVPAAESDRTVQELERTVTYVEQLLDDTDREMAGAATS